MKRKRRRLGLIVPGLCIVVALAAMSLFLVSCGGAKVQTKSKSGGTEKLPPGVTQNQVEGSSSASSSATSSSNQTQSATQGTTSTQQTTATPSASADLTGARFTVVAATRRSNNQTVTSSNGLARPGDYLEIEFTVFNTGATAGLVDLSQYSFRLTSPGIAAGTYSTYYGSTGTYGAYVDANEISGTLLNYSDLSPAAYKVKVGETITKVFLFYDLNPLTNAPNTGVTKGNTSLIIYKTSGTDYGDEVTIPLTGYTF
jgi:hypothetical protein